ncbi:hypothetical protein E5D57_002677 [Metarhizium anisopliae]|nr:hypothetical protein E5D57_002677 [Metarhizium anisopliae]
MARCRAWTLGTTKQAEPSACRDLNAVAGDSGRPKSEQMPGGIEKKTSCKEALWKSNFVRILIYASLGPWNYKIVFAGPGINDWA